MKMRKLFAGLAAAATLLSGMAIGVAAASADPTTDATLTVNHAQEGHTYTAYRIATFENPKAVEGSADTLASVEINTESAWVTPLVNAFNAAGGVSLDTTYEKNPAAYLATKYADVTNSVVREVIDQLTKPTDNGSQLSVDNKKGGKYANVPEGWYVVFDTYLDGEGNTKTGPTALVATKITVDKKEYTKFTLSKEDGQKNIEALGEFNAKNENAPNPPTKSVENVTTTVNDQTVNIGDTVKYTVEHTIPAVAAGSDSYQYFIYDSADKGLDVHTNTIVVKVGEAQLTLNEDYTVTQEPGSSGTKTNTTIEFKSAAAKKHAGQKVTVTYQATVTKEILNNRNQLTNEAKAGNGSQTSGAGTTTVKTYDFQFKKIGVDHNGLDGAKFVVKKDDKYRKQDPMTMAWSDAANRADATVFESKNKGMVDIKGLSSGEYTIEEIEAPAGYAQNFMATFKVNVDAKEGTVTAEKDTLGLVTPGGAGDSVTRVKNIQNIAQLPLTGAAGTVLFTVVALLVGGAGVAVAVKSRRRTY
ncbi:MAG: SpaH/EbpB family LPXTG-anchored major pilin [Bifidobacterium adolescentis]